MSDLQRALAEAFKRLASIGGTEPHLFDAAWQYPDEWAAALISVMPQDWLATHDSDVRRAERARLRERALPEGNQWHTYPVAGGTMADYLRVLLADPEPVVKDHEEARRVIHTGSSGE